MLVDPSDWIDRELSVKQLGWIGFHIPPHPVVGWGGGKTKKFDWPNVQWSHVQVFHVSVTCSKCYHMNDVTWHGFNKTQVSCLPSLQKVLNPKSFQSSKEIIWIFPTPVWDVSRFTLNHWKMETWYLNFKSVNIQILPINQINSSQDFHSYCLLNFLGLFHASMHEIFQVTWTKKVLSTLCNRLSCL